MKRTTRLALAFAMIGAGAGVGMIRTIATAADAPAATADGAALWSIPIDVVQGALATQPAATAPTASAVIADPYMAKTNLAITPLFPNERSLLVPTRPSKYVMTIGNFQSGFELWDLKTGAKDRESPLKVEARDLALSPDGQYIAGYRSGSPDQTGVEVYSMRTFKQVCRLTTADRSFGARVAGFIGNDRVAVFWPATGRESLKVFEIPSGKLLCEGVLDSQPKESEYAQSPTGKYMAVVLRGTVAMYDMSNAQKLGSREFLKREETFGISKPCSIAFSASGKELAVVQQINGNLKSLVMDVATGKPLVEKSVPLNGTKVTEGKPLYWNPDGTALLWGDIVIDRATMTAVYQLPKRDNLLYARWADPTTAIEIYKQATRIAFESVPVTKDQIAKSALNVADGGKIEDASLPPISKIDASAAKSLSMEGAVATPWKVKVWDLPKVTKTITQTFPVKVPSNMPGPAPGTFGARPFDDRTIRMLFTSREAHSVFVEHVAIDPSANVFNDRVSRVRAWIERYDLIAGAVTTTLEPPPGFEALDASDSGKSVVFRSGAAGDRIDVFAMDKAALRPQVAFRPFGLAQGSAEERRMRGNGAELNVIRWAAFVDDNHLLLQSSGFALMLVELPSAKVIWTTTPGAGGSSGQVISDAAPPAFAPGANFEGPPRPPMRRSFSAGDGPADEGCIALSPDRKLAAVCTSNGITLFDPRTGEAFNGLPPSSDRVSARAAGFSADGLLLAAIVVNKAQPFLEVFDLRTGAMTSEVPLSPAVRAAGPVQFAGTGHVLVGGGDLISLEKKTDVYHYVTSGARASLGAVMPYDRIFYAVQKEGRLPASISNAILPHDGAIKATADVKTDTLFAWHPGMSVKLEINCVGDDAYKAKQVAEWTRRLGDAGIKVDDKSTNVIRATTTLAGTPAVQFGNSGRFMPFPGRVPTGPTVSMSFQVVRHDISLTLADKVMWSSVNNRPPTEDDVPSGISLLQKQNESMQDAANRYQQEHQIKEASVIQTPPLYIFNEHPVESAKLGLRGVEPAGAAVPGAPGVPPPPARGRRGGAMPPG